MRNKGDIPYSVHFVLFHQKSLLFAVRAIKGDTIPNPGLLPLVIPPLVVSILFLY
jgi:hypothetical protein